jgi:RNA polymerase sigma-70 factor (ECF subfamily)
VGVTVVHEGEPVVGTRADRFRTLCTEVEPRLRRSLVAAYGPDLGSDAAADALAWAWEHFDRVEVMTNPAGYLWRVGQTSVRRANRRHSEGWAMPAGERGDRAGDHAYEPALAAALTALSDRQRTAVLLVHGYGYTLAEAAEVLGCRIRTLRNHLDRGLAKVRAALGVEDVDRAAAVGDTGAVPAVGEVRDDA